MGDIRKISTNSRYALRFLAKVAERSPERVTTISVAQSEGISEKMLERIASKLAKNGFVTSAKGVKGGYVLARPADEITVTEVLATMETPYLPLHCVDCFETDCKMYGGCNMIKLWEDIDVAIRTVTDKVTVEDIIRDK